MSAQPEIQRLTPVRPGLARRLRKNAGAVLEYLWELSGSVRLYKADAVLVEGAERETGRPFRAFYFGHYDNYAFVLGRAFSELRVVEKHEGCNSLHVRSWLARHAGDVSLLFADVELLFGRLLPTRDYLAIPQWVRQKYVVPETWEEVLGSFRKNTKKTDLRKVRKYGFEVRFARSEEAFREFYHRMYVPYLSRRFADEVIIEPEAKVLRQCRKGELMHIVREERVVAAVLLHLLGDRLAYVWVGVPDDVDDDLFKGAFSAMYYFTIRHGFERGCREIDFLGSRPLLNDGLFRYKRKWGTHVEDSPVPRGDILLRPLHLDGPLRSFFTANHFVVREGRGIAGQVLLDGEPATRDELAALVDRYHTKGLSGLRVFSLAGFAADAREWAARDEAPVRLFDLSDAPDPAAAFCRR
jgi:hypothetical protein